MLKGNYLILVMGNNKINTILLTIKIKNVQNYICYVF